MGTENDIEGTRDEAVVKQTRRWIRRFVVDLNLCPFARRALEADSVRYVVTRATTHTGVLAALREELAILRGDDNIATSFLIHPDALDDFLAYNDFLGEVDELLQAEALEGVFQVASFHPDYRFAGTTARDAENFSNRSPWPMLHVLREDDVETAVNQHPDAEAIPDRNIATLNQIGTEALQAHWNDCVADESPAPAAISE